VGGWVGVGVHESRRGSRWMHPEFHTASSTPGCWPPARTPSSGATPTSGTGACPGTIRLLKSTRFFRLCHYAFCLPIYPVLFHHLPGPTCLRCYLWSILIPPATEGCLPLLHVFLSRELSYYNLNRGGALQWF
jgi:hypothetical protein